MERTLTRFTVNTRRTHQVDDDAGPTEKTITAADLIDHLRQLADSLEKQTGPKGLTVKLQVVDSNALYSDSWVFMENPEDAPFYG